MSTYRPRNIRMGKIWDQAADFAKTNDANMSDLVRIALERFLASPDATDAIEAGRTRARRNDA